MRARITAKPRRSKFGAVRTTVDGVTFASKAEARRYQALMALVRAGQALYLVLQPKYPLEVSGRKVGTYIADFKYWDQATGAWVVEDVKGMVTPVYRLKKKMVEAQYGITITEVRA